MLVGKWLLKNLKSLLLTCKDRTSVSRIQAVLITSGFFNNGSSASQLISHFGRIGDTDSAHKLFDRLPNRNIVSWNALLVAYSSHNNPLEVTKLFRKMNMERVKPDSSTFTVAIKACTNLLDLESGEEIWESAMQFGYGKDLFVCSSVLNLYTKCGKMDEAFAVFLNMNKKDIVSWSTMITGYVRIGNVMEAVNLYRMMQREGFEGDGVVMLALVQGCANVKDFKMGSSLHGYMIRKSFNMDIMVQTSFVDMYAKNDRIGVAFRLFRTMSHINLVSWNALITGCAENEHGRNVLELIIEMQSCGFEPDSVSLLGALMACTQLGSPLLGRAIHGYIVRKLDMDQVLGTTLIDMYAKCGSLSRARVLCDTMNSGDVVFWNTIIASYGIHGEGEEALSLFHQMRESNAKPDHATFASLLSALSHSGLVEEGKYWFEVMIKDYKIQPMEKHYISLIDVLARSGRVEEAHDLIQSMEYEAKIPVWMALLSGCINHKKFLIGELAAKKIVELKPDSSGIYSLVSNFFASARKWDEVAMVRKIMKRDGIKKVPGYSAVEVNGKLHSFMVEDKGHPQYKEISEFMDEMEREMRDMGYVPKTEFVLHNVEEEVKARMLCHHSERIAIAFGILNTGEGSRLVIMKNLRVCGDCHEAIKFISVIAKREIIVRDMKRFHHFKNGNCSCNDYW